MDIFAVRFQPEWRNGRRDGLKIHCPLKMCGFESRLGHENSWQKRQLSSFALGGTWLLCSQSYYPPAPPGDGGKVSPARRKRRPPSISRSAYANDVLTTRGCFGAGHRFFWRQARSPWRRSDFFAGTCATTERRRPICGAGPRIFFGPAPDGAL